MHELLHPLREVLTLERAFALARALIVLGSAFVVARLARRAVLRVLASRLDAQRSMIASRITTGAVFGLGLTWALHELGFQIGVLVGAAGIATVALGIASQTSIQNIVSGLSSLGYLCKKNGLQF